MKQEDILIGVKFSKLNFELSKTEAMLCSKIYFKTNILCCFNDLCVFSIKNNSEKILAWLSRLGFAKEAYLLHSKNNSWKNYFLKYSKQFNLKIGSSASFKICNQNDDTDYFAKEIVDNNLASRVAVKNPDLEFFIFPEFIGLRFWISINNFESRRAHLKKAPHPTTLNPRIARSMINLASAKREVLDPFCGSGGILEEAKIIGLNYFGVDISRNMIDRAKINLNSFENLFCKDAFSWDVKVECVVCDLPYGKSSFLYSDIDELVFKFLNHFKIITSKIVVCLPSSVNIDVFLEKTGWKKSHFFNIYVHKSLTRVIYVLDK